MTMADKNVDSAGELDTGQGFKSNGGEVTALGFESDTEKCAASISASALRTISSSMSSSQHQCVFGV